MSRAALLRELNGKRVTMARTYTGPTMEAANGWPAHEHGHTTTQRGTLEVRSRELVFWDSRWERKPGGGMHFYGFGIREGDAIVIRYEDATVTIKEVEG